MSNRSGPSPSELRTRRDSGLNARGDFGRIPRQSVHQRFAVRGERRAEAVQSMIPSRRDDPAVRIVDLRDSIATNPAPVNSTALKRSPAIDFPGYRQIPRAFITVLPYTSARARTGLPEPPRVFKPPMTMNGWLLSPACLRRSVRRSTSSRPARFSTPILPAPRTAKWAG